MQYILSISEINKYIKEIFARDLILSNLWVRGEISNYKYHSSGHMYFTVKDENSLIRCVMFRTYNSSLRFLPENGMKVLIKGYVSVFERDGQYQLYAEEMKPDGLGDLHMAFEQLKKKLQDEGLFDSERKKSIPYLPESIGIITSSTGAVIRDIINVLNRRFGNFSLKVFPVAVQGEQAPFQISNAIEKLNEKKYVDVIIIARGGGSLEELWAFNEEIVARSIASSNIPIISAVGHETDFTIADFVADLRAPTPSAAAELVLPEKMQLIKRLHSLNSRLRSSTLKNLTFHASRLDKVKNSVIFRRPYDKIYQERMRLDVLNKYMQKGLQVKMERTKSKFQLLAGKLDTLSPLTILSRGYSVVKKQETGTFVKSVCDVSQGEILDISVKDGRISCAVNKISGTKDG